MSGDFEMRSLELRLTPDADRLFFTFSLSWRPHVAVNHIKCQLVSQGPECLQKEAILAFTGGWRGIE